MFNHTRVTRYRRFRFEGREADATRPRSEYKSVWNHLNGEWLRVQSDQWSRVWVCRRRCSGGVRGRHTRGRRIQRGYFELSFTSCGRLFGGNQTVVSLVERGMHSSKFNKRHYGHHDNSELPDMWAALERMGFPKRPDGWDKV